MTMDGKAMNKLQLVLFVKCCVWRLHMNAKKPAQLSAGSPTDPEWAIYELIILNVVKNQSETQAKPLNSCNISGITRLKKAGNTKTILLHSGHQFLGQSKEILALNFSAKTRAV